MDVRVEPNDDPALATAVEHAAGWTRSLEENARRFRAYPGGHFVARAGDETVGVVSAYVHRDAGQGALAWIGGMVVGAAWRRRGVGSALMTAALAHARAHGANCVALDATPEGRLLYERLGFRAVCSTPKMTRAGPPTAPLAPGASIYPISSCEIMELYAYDASRFGANRAPWLATMMAEFPTRSFVAFERAGNIAGYALAGSNIIGPLVADSPTTAARLLFACERAGAPAVVLPRSDCPGALEVLAAAGYAPTGAGCTRMVLGGELPGRAQTQFGIAGYSLG